MTEVNEEKNLKHNVKEFLADGIDSKRWDRQYFILLKKKSFKDGLLETRDLARNKSWQLAWS